MTQALHKMLAHFRETFLIWKNNPRQMTRRKKKKEEKKKNRKKKNKKEKKQIHINIIF